MPSLSLSRSCQSGTPSPSESIIGVTLSVTALLVTLPPMPEQLFTTTRYWYPFMARVALVRIKVLDVTPLYIALFERLLHELPLYSHH